MFCARFLQYDFTVSFLEIYNEVIRDLLGSGKDDCKHEIRLVAAGSSEVYVTDLTTVSVCNKEQVCISLFPPCSHNLYIHTYINKENLYSAKNQ